MKINEAVRTIKHNLLLNFDIKEIFETPSQENLLTKWGSIIKTIDDILNTGICDKCYQEIYEELNDLLIYDIPQNIIDDVNRLLMDYSVKIYDECNQLINDSGDFFMKFNMIWGRIRARFNLIYKILNKFEKKTFRNKSIYFIFVDLFSKKNDTASGFLAYLINMINNELITCRKKTIEKTIDFSDEFIKTQLAVIQYGIQLLKDSNVYRETYHNTLVNSTSKFYSELSSQALNSYTLENYITLVLKILDMEKKIVINHLDQSSLKSIIDNLNQILIINHTNEILDIFFSKNNDYNTIDSNVLLIDNYALMNKIYSLFKLIRIEDTITKCFGQYITQCFNKIISSEGRNSEELFNQLLLLKGNIDSFIQSSFDNDDKFKAIGKEYLSKAINLKPNYITDSLATYINLVLINDIIINNDEKAIEDFMLIFKYLDAKDLFEKLFNQKMVYCYLYSQRINKNIESLLLTQLKKECGGGYVSKTEEILSDCNTSDSLTKEYHDNKITEHSKKFSFYIFSNYSFPFTKMITGNVNAIISEQELLFGSFYKVKNTGKTLTWILPFSNCILGFSLKGKEYSIKANGIHASILMQFTQGNQNHKKNDLIKMSQVDRNDILPYLNQLSQVQLLTYDDKTDNYSFNQAFNSSNEEITLVNVIKKELAMEDLEKVEERSIEDRKPVIDCFILRILKSKKQMKNEDLIISVHSALKFPCDRQNIVNRLNHLLENNYIVKDTTDENIIKYN